MIEPKLNLAGQTITQSCKQLVPDKNNAVLLNALQALIPDYPVRLALTGDEWYQLGGVVDAQGTRLAKDLVEWAERTYIECGQNLQTLIDHTLEQKLIATKKTGRTLYFVVQTGEKAEDFTLIEIDKIHEVSDRLLADEAHPPEDLEEFIDPLHPLCVEPLAFGQARYVYRRKTDVAIFMEVINERNVSEHPVQRFMDDWNRSSAGQTKHLSENWIIRPYRHTGRFGEQIVNAEIINIETTNLPHLEDFAGKKGTALSNILTRFDRQAGYAFAWFFYMLKGKMVSTDSAEAVYRDISGDFSYLPPQDEAILRDWIASPYNV